MDPLGLDTSKGGSKVPTGTIRMSVINNGLQDLQHEYGHVLDYKQNGRLSYIFKFMPVSLFQLLKKDFMIFSR